MKRKHKLTLWAVFGLLWYVAVKTPSGTETQASSEPQTGRNVAAQSKAPQSFSTPPNLKQPQMTLWKPDFSKNTACNTSTGKCKPLPKDDFYCVDEETRNAQQNAEGLIVAAGKKCKKWGESWMDRQIRGEKISVPARNSDLDSAVTLVTENKQVHITWLNGGNPEHSVEPTADMICYSKKDDEKRFDFFREIFQRCYEWAE